MIRRSAPEHGRCRELLEGWRAGPLPWYLTWGIVYEFLPVATHPQVFRRLWSLEARGPSSGRFSHTAILMREHGIRRIYTRDADFHRLPFLEVLDPLAG